MNDPESEDDCVYTWVDLESGEPDIQTLISYFGVDTESLALEQPCFVRALPTGIVLDESNADPQIPQEDVFALLKESESDVLWTEDVTFENLGLFIANLQQGRIAPFLSYGPPSSSSVLADDDYYIDYYNDEEVAHEGKRPSSQKDEL